MSKVCTYNICWQVVIVGSWAKSVLITYADKLLWAVEQSLYFNTTYADMLLWAVDQNLYL